MLFSAEWEVVKAIKQSKNREIIKAAVTTIGYFEEELHFDYCAAVQPSTVFIEVMSELLKDHSIEINSSAVAFYRKYAGEETKPEPRELTLVQQRQLEKAVEFCTKLRLFEVNDFPIVVTKTLGKGILGLAKQRTIYLALETFDMGTKMVAITLIEEYIHLSLGYSDMTRAMQNHLFNKIITLGEELAGEPL